MREIKFRAWDKNKKYMVYDNDTKWNHKSYPVWVSHRGIVYCTRLEFKPGEGNFEFDAYKWKDIEIMQYTGLKDKNGKEIYEGDIVKMHQAGRLCEVVWFTSEEFCGWDLKFLSFYDEDSPSISRAIFRNLEIVGNIYDNPELLKNLREVITI